MRVLAPLLLAATAYVLVRFTEAYGLWKDRWWGEWLGALSGALYIPFELWHFAHHPSLASAAVSPVHHMKSCGVAGPWPV